MFDVIKVIVFKSRLSPLSSLEDKLNSNSTSLNDLYQFLWNFELTFTIGKSSTF